ncbi:MAG: family 10 glycosylhydrolase [Planctomycetota bacterium]
MVALPRALPRALVLSLLLAACTPSSDPQLSLWVTRFDYRTPEDVRTALANAADAGFDSVLWQVRGNATTFYASELEPWAIELVEPGGAPGFDPLALAIEEARRLDLELHAWINVIPAWWGPEPPPADLEHLYHTRPAWFWYDQYGERQALSERFYVSLNPCLPEVRAHIVAVVRELLERYPKLDGLHLDYLRFPNEPPATRPGQDFPRDPKTLALYRADIGLAPGDDAAAWNAWRTAAVTELLAELRDTVRSVAPDAELSAAVGPEPELALHHFQDVDAWLARRLVDRIHPMNYTTDPERFAARLAAWKQRAGTTPVSMGVRLDAGPLDERTQQAETALAKFGAITCFAYSSLFDSPNEAIDAQDGPTRTIRAERRAWFLPRLRSWSLGDPQ